MSYVERNLLPGERLLFRTRLHWIMFARPALVALGGGLAALALGGVPGVEWLPWLGGALVLAALGWGLVRYVELRTSEFAVTTARLVFKVGLLARYTTELLLGKVETVGVTQSLAGRLLGFGDLTVTGTGGAREVFRRVHDPIAFRNHVQQASLAADGGAGAAPGAGAGLRPGHPG